MPEVDAKLATALKAAKTSPMFFALVAKGSADGALLVSKGAVPPKQITEAKAKCGGGTAFQGRCFGEDGKMVFELGKEPPATLAKQIRLLAMRDAGVSLVVITRCNDELESESAEDETDAPPTDNVAEPDLSAAYTTRLKAAGVALVKAAKTDLAVAARLKPLFAKATALIGQKAFAEADGPLAELERGLTASPGAPPAPPPKTSAPPTQEADTLTARLKKLAPQYLVAIKAVDPETLKQLQNLFSLANNLLKKGDFAMCGVAVTKLEALVSKGPTAGPSAPTQPKGAKVAYAQLRLAWDAAQKGVQSELKKLEKAILEAFKNEPFAPELPKHVHKLNAVLDGFQGNLGDVLDDALNATDDAKRRQHQEAAVALIKQYRNYVNSDPFIKDVEKNPFVPVNITKSLSTTLELLAKRLEAGV
jgi:hypothetical protein